MFFSSLYVQCCYDFQIGEKYENCIIAGANHLLYRDLAAQHPITLIN